MSSRLFDPDPEEDRPGPADVARVLPNHLRDLDGDVPARIRRLQQKLLAMATSQLRNKKQYHGCQWEGCDQPGVDWRHSLPREVAGRFSEFLPRYWLCKEHHDIVTELFAAWLAMR